MQGVPVHDASQDSPELPEGWRNADDDLSVEDPLRVRRRRVRLMLAFVAGALVLAYVIGLPLWNASAHYSRGVLAMNSASYAWAAEEFDAAKIVFVPYRDSAARAQEARQAALEARQAATAADAARSTAEARLAAAAAGLDKAQSLLTKGNASAVLAALRDIPTADLKAAAVDPEVRDSIDVLSGDMVAAGRKALTARRWGTAARYARAIVVLDPASKRAVGIQKRAQAGLALSAKLADARAAAQQRRWREALRLGLAILAVDKSFPGAADIVADARAALKPKKKATTTVSAPAPAPVTPVVPRPAAPPAPPPP